MIKEYEYLHGVVFTRLCSNFDKAVHIRPYSKNGYSAYVVNECAGLYIKYCGKRLTPWRFSLSENHQREILELHERFGEVFIALVCYLDGVVILNYKELKIILDEVHEGHEWISVARKKNEMYTLCASDGKLGFKVSKTSCPDKVFAYLQ